MDLSGGRTNSLHGGTGSEDAAGVDAVGRRLVAGLDVPGCILRCRRTADLSQRDLAAVLGVSPSTVARWETGEREPSARTLASILEVGGYRLVMVIDEVADAVAGNAAAPEEAEESSVEQLPVPQGEDQGIPSMLRVSTPWPGRHLRDSRGRRLPAHLDVHLSDKDYGDLRWGWFPDQKVFTPGRLYRDNLRLRRRPWVPGESLTKRNTLTRTFSDMASDEDYAQWRMDIWLARQQRAKPGPSAPDCRCPVDCEETITCPPTCPCGCESEESRVLIA